MYWDIKNRGNYDFFNITLLSTVYRNGRPLEEELDGIDIDGIVSLKDAPRLELIDEECKNLRIVNDGGEITGNIYQKKLGILHQSTDVHYLTNAVDEIISSITMWNTVNQFGKHDFSVNKLKERQYKTYFNCVFLSSHIRVLE